LKINSQIWTAKGLAVSVAAADGIEGTTGEWSGDKVRARRATLAGA